MQLSLARHPVTDAVAVVSAVAAVVVVFAASSVAVTLFLRPSVSAASVGELADLAGVMVQQPLVSSFCVGIVIAAG